MSHRIRRGRRGNGGLIVRRIRCVVEYLGTRYAGFQRQPGKETVQAVLEQAISGVTQEQISVTGSGRTDAGAHAYHQVIAFSTQSALAPSRWATAINAHLPDDVAVISADEVAATFDPRKDALSRVYRYLIWNRRERSPFKEQRAAHVKHPLDVGAMNEAARLLVGEHDFTAFVAEEVSDARRTVYDAHCWREDDLVAIELRASGFMKQMVRSIAGTLIEVGVGKLRPDAITGILASRRRDQAGNTAPACGLYLVDVWYSDSPAANRSEERA